MLDIAGTQLTADDEARIRHPGTSGVILFSSNFEHKDQLIDLVRSIRQTKPDVLIAVDHEGGRIQRFRQGFTELPAMGQFKPVWDGCPARAIALAVETGWLMAAELLACGIDLSFAPVLDLDYGNSEVIGDRAFARDPHIVSQLAAAFVSGAKAAGMSCVGKHFPGHGYVAGDSHHVLPEDYRSLESMLMDDLVPFEQLAPMLDGIMPAHVLYSQVCDKPAGFSAQWLQTVLRERFQFDGVVFSDDLTMEGAVGLGSYTQRTKAALDAGCDMVLVCYNSDGADEVLESGLTVGAMCPKRYARIKADWASIMNGPTLQSTRRWQKALEAVQSV